MNLKMIGVTLLLAVSASFAASCSQPTQAAAQSQAEGAAVQNVAASGGSQAKAQPSSAAPPASITGEYAGDFGDAGTAVTISGSAPHYNVHVIVGGDGCGGGALGPARADNAGVLTVHPTDAPSCTITMTPNSGGYSVAESGCSNLHGDTCSFDGEVHRAH